MPRVTALRFLFAVLAFVAGSMDTATKVLHGVVHEREAVAHAHGGTVHTAVDEHRLSVEAADDGDLDHAALHHAASATRLLKVPLAVAPTLQLAAATITIAAGQPAEFPTNESPPAVRAGPRQPRAPPTV